MNPFEKAPTIENRAEAMQMPEVVFQEERMVTQLSILLKGADSSWGSDETELAKKVTEFLQQNPLGEKAKLFLEEIRWGKEDGIDEESLFNIASTIGHSEREAAVFAMLQKHKDFPVEALPKLQAGLAEALTEMENSLPEELKNEIIQFVASDLEKREQSREATEKQIQNLIDFFRPLQKTTPVEKVTILTTNFLYAKNSGYGFDFGKEWAIMSHRENELNQRHEFLHSVINPITEKLFQQLSPEQKQKIVDLGSASLKADEGYGDSPSSLLNEEFIRIYTQVVQKEAYEEFLTKNDIENLSEEKFQGAYDNEKGGFFKIICDEIGIVSADDFRLKSQAYFERSEHDRLSGLGEIIFSFYQKYIQEKEMNQQVCFEDFVLREFGKEI